MNPSFMSLEAYVMGWGGGFQRNRTHNFIYKIRYRVLEEALCVCIVLV